MRIEEKQDTEKENAEIIKKTSKRRKKKKRIKRKKNESTEKHTEDRQDKHDQTAEGNAKIKESVEHKSDQLRG